MAISIFSPRRVKFVAKDGTISYKDYIAPGQNNFEEYYIDRELIYVPQPVEGSDEEYILIPKIKETKRSIKEVIDSQADDVGLDNALRKFALTGDPSVLPGPVQANDNILDLTSLPEDSADYFKYIHGLASSFEALPVELRKDLTMEEFTKKVINGEINVDAYFESIKLKEKTEEKDGDK